MKKNKHLVIAGIALVVVGIACFVWYLADKGVFASILGKRNTIDSENKQTNNTPVPTDAFPLRKGSSGTNVRRLQEKLNAAIVYFLASRPFMYDGKQLTKIEADGVFGKKTQAAVNWYYMINKAEVTEAEFNQIKGK